MCKWGKRYFNRIFQVIQFEVKQGGGEQVFEAAALEDGKITVEVTLHYITLHCITLLNIRLHYETLHWRREDYRGDDTLIAPPHLTQHKSIETGTKIIER